MINTPFGSFSLRPHRPAHRDKRGGGAVHFSNDVVDYLKQIETLAASLTVNRPYLALDPRQSLPRDWWSVSMKPILVGWVERVDRTHVRLTLETHRRAV
jgi:hypothetical protein